MGLKPGNKGTKTVARKFPIACCHVNEVEAWDFPFFIKKGKGIEDDQILLDFHLWHMTEEEKTAMGNLIRISSPQDLEDIGYRKDDRGVYIVEG